MKVFKDFKSKLSIEFNQLAYTKKKKIKFIDIYKKRNLSNSEINQLICEKKNKYKIDFWSKSSNFFTHFKYINNNYDKCKKKKINILKYKKSKIINKQEIYICRKYLKNILTNFLNNLNKINTLKKNWIIIINFLNSIKLIKNYNTELITFQKELKNKITYVYYIIFKVKKIIIKRGNSIETRNKLNIYNSISIFKNFNKTIKLSSFKITKAILTKLKEKFILLVKFRNLHFIFIKHIKKFKIGYNNITIFKNRNIKNWNKIYNIEVQLFNNKLNPKNKKIYLFYKFVKSFKINMELIHYFSLKNYKQLDINIINFDKFQDKYINFSKIKVEFSSIRKFINDNK